MNRWVVLLMAIVGGAIAAWGATLGFAGALGGFLWIFVFGDDPWPAWTNYAGGIAAFAVGAATWLIVGRAIWLRFRSAT